MAVIAKFHVNEVANRPYSAEVKLSAVMPSVVDGKPEFENPEDEKFWEATPSGSITMTINNPGAAEQFQAGEHWYVRFERVGNGR